MIDACEAAYAATGDRHWQSQAVRAYRWFLGDNDLGLPIADPATGECCDGLMPTGVNGNQGAESVLAFHMATVAINRLMAEIGRSPQVTLDGATVMAHQTSDASAAQMTAKLSCGLVAHHTQPAAPPMEQPPLKVVCDI